MAKVEQSFERASWLGELRVGDPVKLETLMGYHRARIQKIGDGLLTVKITDGRDVDIDGWEVKVSAETGVGEWRSNVIHPIDAETPKTGQDELVLEYIGDAPKDVPLQGWEAA